MNKIYYLLAFLTFLCACDVEDKDSHNDWTKSNLNGKIMSVKESYYRAENQLGNTEESFESRGGFETVFNMQGYKILYTTHESDGRISSENRYKYDDKNNLIEEEVYYSDELSFRNLYTYDDKDNLIEKTTLNADGKLSLRQLYKHNNSGNIIEERHHNNEDIFYNKIVFQYDERNNVIEKNNYDANDLHCLSTNYEYDDSGNMIEEDFQSLLDSMFDYKNLFKYDDKGNVVEKNYLSNDDDISSKRTVEYVFDEKGNWIKSMEYKDGTQQNIVIKEIEYFK